jgi:phenylalanine-4-hydroxylase
LQFTSGVRVAGWVKQIRRKNGQVVLISFEQCSVTLRDQILFRPQWGTYDMAVGASILSVYAGAADRERFYADETHSTDAIQPQENVNGASTNIHPTEAVLNELYQLVRDTREKQWGKPEIIENFKHVSKQLDAIYPNDWLLRLEIMEILSEHKLNDELSSHLENQLEKLKKHNGEFAPLIENGLLLINRIA